MSSLLPHQTGIVGSKEEGNVVVLLPAGPIRSTVEGVSGQTYEQVLVDDSELGHPTARIVSLPVIGTIYHNHI